MSKEPPKCQIDAVFYKLKADHFRYIYECLSGESGLLRADTEKQSFFEYIEDKKSEQNNLNKDNAGGFEYEKVNIREKMTILQYFEMVTKNEYENAKSCIIRKQDEKSLMAGQYDQVVVGSKEAKKSLDKESKDAPYHPIFLSALMNQQVFVRDLLLQEIKDKSAQNKAGDHDHKVDMEIEREKSERIKAMIEYVKKYLNHIEVKNCAAEISKNEDSKLHWTLIELLEKTVDQWDDEIKMI